MARRTKRTLREKAAHINFRTPKNYVDNVVEACVASGKDPNELGQVGMMLLINHRFFDFDKRLHDVEQHMADMKKMQPELFRIGELLDHAVGTDD